MNSFLNSVFSGIGGAILGDVQTAENYAVAAFSVLAGELLIIMLLLGAILLWGIAVIK